MGVELLIVPGARLELFLRRQRHLAGRGALHHRHAPRLNHPCTSEADTSTGVVQAGSVAVVESAPAREVINMVLPVIYNHGFML